MLKLGHCRNHSKFEEQVENVIRVLRANDDARGAPQSPSSDILVRESRVLAPLYAVPEGELMGK